MPYRTGELDQQVDLRRRALTTDAGGGATEAWTPYASGVWALVRPKTGREQEQAMRRSASADYLVVLHWRDDVREDDVVRWDGRDLNVLFVRRRGERALFLELDCASGVAV